MVFIWLDSRKTFTCPALIPKFTLSVISFPKPATATATRWPVSWLIIGPPLLPGFRAASICNLVESSSIPFNELIIPDVNFKSSLKYLPKGYPAAIICCNFFGALSDILM